MICVTELRANFKKNLEQKSMLGGLFKKKDVEVKQVRDISDQLYSCALLNTRDPIFYSKYGVPDTFDGRFDLLLIHVFIIFHTIMGHREYETISQALFDSVFKDMDQTLREMGIGDMGVPKHMKRMMKAFNGRMYSYQLAVDSDSLEGHEIEGLKKTTLKEALKRNLYGTVKDDEGWDETVLDEMEKFIMANIEDKTSERVSGVLDGHIKYLN